MVIFHSYVSLPEGNGKCHGDGMEWIFLKDLYYNGGTPIAGWFRMENPKVKYGWFGRKNMENTHEKWRLEWEKHL